MKNKLKKVAVIAMSTLVLAQSSAVFAASFPDVTKSGQYGWAYEYIDEMSNKGVITGYEDGTFKPGNNITYLETLKLISGVINADKSEINTALETYKTVLTENKVPDWAKEAVAISLKRGATNESEVKMAAQAGMIEIGTNKRIDRMTISVYLARALELEPKTVSSLKYKDANEINKDFVNLIAALIDTGVLHEDGRDGLFEPDKPVRRSEVAKMIKTAYDYVGKNPLKGGSAVDASKLTAEKGDIVQLSEVNSKTFLVYKTAGATKSKSVTIVSTTKVLDSKGNTIKSSDLVEGQSVEIKVNPNNNEAVEIKMTSEAGKTEGTVEGVNSNRNEVQIKYTVNGISQTKTYELASNANITEDGKTARFSDIKIGDSVDFYPNSNLKLDKLDIIRNRNKDANYRFVKLGSEDALWNYRKIIVRHKDKSYDEEFNLANNADIYSGNTRISMNSLRTDDYLTLRFDSKDSKLVTRIDIGTGNYTGNNNVTYELRNNYLGSVGIDLFDRDNRRIGNGPISLSRAYIYVDDKRVDIDLDRYNLPNVDTRGEARVEFYNNDWRDGIDRIYFTSSRNTGYNYRVRANVEKVRSYGYGLGDEQVELSYNDNGTTRTVYFEYYRNDRPSYVKENATVEVLLDRNGKAMEINRYY